MNSRERVLKTLNLETPDRPPLDGWFLLSVFEQLKKHYNVEHEDDVMEKLGIDFRNTCMVPADHPEDYPYFEKLGISIRIADYLMKNCGNDEFESEWGERIKLHGDNDLDWKYSHHPLNVDGKIDINRLILPDLSTPGRFDNVKRDVDRWKGDYMVCAGATMLFRKCWILSGFSDFLESLYLERDTVEKLLDILTDYIIDETERYIDAGVDIIQLGGDLGSEESMLINPDLWRELFKPRLTKIISATKRDGVFFYLHSDGGIEPIIPDLIEAGIDILNPIQPECMDPAMIKDKYGTSLTLHGTMSVQKMFPFESSQEIADETDNRIKTCGYNGGLILGPTNAFTSDISVEKIVSFYEYAGNVSVDELLKT